MIIQTVRYLLEFDSAGGGHARNDMAPRVNDDVRDAPRREKSVFKSTMRATGLGRHLLGKMKSVGWTKFLPRCALILCLLSVPAAEAINLESTVTANSTANVSNLTWTHVLASVSNGILIVGISFRDGNVVANSVIATFGATPFSLTRIGFVNTGGNQNRTEMWYLLAPPTGTASITVAMSQSKIIAAASNLFSGVNQTTPLGTFASALGSSTSASVAVTSAGCQIVVDTVTANGDAVSLISGALQTPRWNVFSGAGGGDVGSAGSTEPGATSTTMSWTLGVSKPWSIGAVPLRPDASSAQSYLGLKTVQVTSDPVNGSTNPRSIPGAYELYTVRFTNQGSCPSPDNNSIVIVDPIPANTVLFVGDLAGVGSGPIAFVDGSPASGLSYTFTSLSSATDDVAFSSDGGSTFTYTPAPDVNGFDASVTHVRISPKGVFGAVGGGATRYFDVSFRVRVK
jgi:hypothetical protein